MKKVKFIYINLRFYGRSFPDQSHDFFYLFGVGNLFSYQLLKINSDIEVENWRADNTVRQDLERRIDCIKCRVFKGRNTKFAGTFSWSLIKALRNIIKQKEYYVLVHFHGMHNIGFDIISWLIPRVPIVVTHHGGGNLLYKYHRNKKLKTLIAEKIDRYSLINRCDHAFVQTETEKSYLSSFMPATSISRFTLFGFDFDVFKPMNKEEARGKLGLSADKKILLSIGRADPLKGVHHVVDVYLKMKKTEPDLELLCVDVQPVDLFYNAVKESGAIIVGHVSWYDLPVYYSAANVLLYLPFDDESINFAGPGYVNAEALACGIPVVSSLLVNYWDDSINKVARIPKNTEEAMVMTHELLNNPPLPTLCREVAYKFFNWDYVMKRYLEVYRSLIEKYYGTYF